MYKQTNTTSIIRLSDNAFIPADPANTDFAAYQQWLSEGNTPEPAEPPSPIVITSVTMRQARLALLQNNWLDQVESAINQLPSPQKERALIEWEYSNAVERNKGVVSMIAPALGLSDDDVDALFLAASKL